MAYFSTMVPPLPTLYVSSMHSDNYLPSNSAAMSGSTSIPEHYEVGVPCDVEEAVTRGLHKSVWDKILQCNIVELFTLTDKMKWVQNMAKRHGALGKMLSIIARWFCEFCKSCIDLELLDDALGPIHSFGTSALLEKLDTDSSFKLLLMHPGAMQYMGFKLNGQFYVNLPILATLCCDWLRSPVWEKRVGSLHAERRNRSSILTSTDPLTTRYPGSRKPRNRKRLACVPRLRARRYKPYRSSGNRLPGFTGGPRDSDPGEEGTEDSGHCSSTAYLKETARDIGLLGSNAMAVSARRVLWIHQLNADADSKKNMESLPYKGDVLFSDGLADLVSTSTTVGPLPLALWLMRQIGPALSVLTAVVIQKGDAICYSPSATGTQLCSTCSGGGSCTPDNGCSCVNDPATICVPTTECASVDSNICCPRNYYWSATDNCCTDVLICNPACKNDLICTNISSVATCSCNTTLYSGLNSSALSPVIQCGSNTISVSLSKCLLESLGYDVTTIELNNSSSSCVNIYEQTVNNTTMEAVQVLPETGWCGNTVQTDSLKVYYSNVLHIGLKNSIIITSNPVNISFSCSYNLTMQTSLAAAFNAVVNTINLTANGEGSVLTTMAAYWDQAYAVPILSTEDVPVGSNIYLGIFSDFVDVTKFVLRVESCYATPDNNANNVNKVAIVTSGCPANQGITAVVQENGVSLQSRIEFSSFAFQGQPLVYITCTVRLCDTNTTCTGCNAARDSNNGQAQLQIPLNLIDVFSSSESNTAVSWTVMTSSLLALLTTKLF
ncbi:uncharacterized protein LOC135050428 [Pseudophryne corroboree]|uniref:uncharacterized protein LOC135050428 n=1 Tax=Pseudophryne corroboree TaxID=495146 RepID=UPI003081449E